MDIFKFHNPTSPTKMEQGEIINDLKRKMWIERYRDSSEFELVARVNSGIREKLPIGSFISHVDAHEIMIVENHEINEDQGNRSDIIITGRSFETFLDNRIIGSNQAFTGWPFSNHLVWFGTTWDQAVRLIKYHTYASELFNDDNAIPYFSVLSSVSGDGEVVQRLVKSGPLYTRIIEFLEIDNLGIKSVRPGYWSPLGPDNENLALVIHKGIDRTAEVIFSYDSGDIVSADYLWSNKKLKNGAYISGKWISTAVESPETGYNRRMMLIDATDIDESFTSIPIEPDLSNIISSMQQRGIDTLLSQNEVAITKAEPSKNAAKFIYRTDFDVGDIVTVHGNYNEVSSMRISEYVEIEDETGTNGYPTFTME